MKIVRWRIAGDIDVQFLDDYSHIVKGTTYNNFCKGQIKNPYNKTVCGTGMIGCGKYKSVNPDGNDNREYQI